MVTHVILNDDSTYTIDLDDGAKELLQQISRYKHIDSTAVLAEIINTGILIQSHLFIHSDKSGT